MSPEEIIAHMQSAIIKKLIVDCDAGADGDDPLSLWLRRRFREITWAQGLWDLCAEGLLICPSACKMKIHDRPLFGTNGEIIGFDPSRRIVVVNENDPEQIMEDAVRRINTYE